MGMFDFFKKQRKCVMVNDTLIITLKNGNQLTLNKATIFQYDTASDSEYSDERIEELYFNWIEAQNDNKIPNKSIQIKEEKKQEEDLKLEKAREEINVIQEITNSYPTLISTGEFTEKDGSIYMNIVPNLSIPNLLVRKFVELSLKLNDNEDALDEFVALQKFWMWCSLNPNSESRENLFRFIQNNNLKVNKHGFLCAYRRVVSVDSESENQNKELSKELTKFISESYIKVKTAKKGPKNFSIYYEIDNANHYMIIHNDKIAKPEFQDQNYAVMGNLYDLYQNLSNPTSTEIPVQTFTDQYTGTFDIRLGKEVSMPPEECDWNNEQACSRGLTCSPTL